MKIASSNFRFQSNHQEFVQPDPTRARRDLRASIAALVAVIVAAVLLIAPMIARADEPSPTPTATPAAIPASPTTGEAAAPAPPAKPIIPSAPLAIASEKASCLETIESTVRPQNRERLKSFCDKVERLPACSSAEGRPIQHIDSDSGDLRAPKRILVFGMIHGDEPLSGEMALEWAERLKTIEHRNSWRIVPMLNPDGLKRKTRMNAHSVDLNRNFPTKDWVAEAMPFWKKTGKEDPRRYPGDNAASEPETRCAIAQIKEFKPDFIVSVHTPYKVLDFDGPQMKFPRYKDLPWRSLGNFPGSLGRYMWRDYQVPVLTVELGTTMVDAAQLQDLLGSFAIEAARRSGQKTAGTFDTLM